MAVYMLLARFSPEGAKGLESEGFVSRRATAEKVVAAVGGRQLGYYACSDGEWDVINISEWPSGTAAAEAANMVALLRRSGAYSATRLMALATPEEYEASKGNIASAQQAWRPPGQG